MDEADQAEMMQKLAFAGLMGDIAVKTLCNIIPVLVARGALDAIEVETMHALLLAVEQSGMLSEADARRLARTRQQLSEDDPG